MDDFLHNLRSGNLKRGGYKNRPKYSDPHYTRQQENAYAKNVDPQAIESENVTSLLMDILPDLKALLADLVAPRQEYNRVMKLRAEAEERKAKALESIAQVLATLAQQPEMGIRNVMPTMPVATNEERGEPSPARAVPQSGGEEIRAEKENSSASSFSMKGLEGVIMPTNMNQMSRDEVLEKIKEFRDNGLSFAVIAQFLEREGVATFSGRGKWHAPTIANLLKQART